jgi:NTP pyrophosphatase (non-canonical NTP hydrolase)
MYYIYHIPGKKIGVTRDLNKRVTHQQGYSADEYEVLEQSDDIDYISDREIELQRSYGYKIDLKKYKNLNQKPINMKVNVTEQTTTFPIPLNKLKGNLMDNLGLTWSTDLGEFELTTETIKWIVNNAKTSMFNLDRSFIYNKAFYETFLNRKAILYPEDFKPTRFDLIRSWAIERGIYAQGDSKTQYIKLMEESGELAQAILKNNKADLVDAIGDMIIVLTNLAQLNGMLVESCIDSAYNEIANRKGKMINGTFAKETL